MEVTKRGKGNTSEDSSSNSSSSKKIKYDSVDDILNGDLQEPAKLSARGMQYLQELDLLSIYVEKCMTNKYDPVNNPKGMINLGTALNSLMEVELTERMCHLGAFTFDPEEHQHYTMFAGKPKAQKAFANFMNNFFDPIQTVAANEIIVINSFASSLDALCSALFDPDDYCLSPTPGYSRIFRYSAFKAHVQVLPWKLSFEPNSDGVTFSVCPEELEKRIKELNSEGKTIRGLIFVSPSNPQGDVFSPTTLTKILNICEKYKVHAIIDEVYAFSIFKPGVQFRSVLSLPNTNIDKNRLHVMWSFSKDFTLSGFRLGMVHTRNKALRSALETMGQFFAVPSIIQDVAASILNDTEWLKTVFFPMNWKRLLLNYKMATTCLKQNGAKIRDCAAGLFIFVDFSAFLEEKSWKAETALFERMASEGVYIVPGSALQCDRPGWFRIVFSPHHNDLTEGLKRICHVLQEAKKSNPLMLNN